MLLAFAPDDHVLEHIRQRGRVEPANLPGGFQIDLRVIAGFDRAADNIECPGCSGFRRIDESKTGNPVEDDCPSFCHHAVFPPPRRRDEITGWNGKTESFPELPQCQVLDAELRGVVQVDGGTQAAAFRFG